MKGISQDSSTIKPITYYRITMGGDLGKGYPHAESQSGVGGTFRAAIQREKICMPQVQLLSEKLKFLIIQMSTTIYPL